MSRDELASTVAKGLSESQDTVAKTTEAAIDSIFGILGGRSIIGQVLGILPYMSPEQVNGNSALDDCRSDVYGLGAIGFELSANAYRMFCRVSPPSRQGGYSDQNQ